MLLPNVCATQKARYHSERIGQFAGPVCALQALVGRIGHVLCDSILSAGIWLDDGSIFVHCDPVPIAVKFHPDDFAAGNWGLPIGLSLGAALAPCCFDRTLSEPAGMLL